METLKVKKNQIVFRDNIPLLPYEEFFTQTVALLQNPDCQLVDYTGYRVGHCWQFVGAIAHLADQSLQLSRYELVAEPNILLPAISKHHLVVFGWERAIFRSFGIIFVGNPWTEMVYDAFYPDTDMPSNYL